MKLLYRKMSVPTFMLLTLLLCTGAFADVSVIVHPSNSSAMDSADIAKLFLGKGKKFPTGDAAFLVVHDGDSAKEFNREVVKKTPSQFKAYWSKLAFSGKGTPPKSLPNENQVKSLVATNPNAIGYIDTSLVDDSVKVLVNM